ncbi:GNAT family N-acetyltransferase [Tabrizicola flagellatus]|uniref:GNAT family N-acetyltransferase n=1 Tax=Tabrizicola flagellatus TaxID=2593021 RepID=UPI0011F1DCD7|nr:GNAT family N-acetyltransferase [Tabrizicola flagellatus]
MTLRPFLPSDIPAARALWQATPGVGLSAADEPAALQAFLARNPGTSFVAESGGRLAGTILVGHDGRRGLIHHLAVAGDQRRSGHGRRLVAAGLAALRAQGIDKCHLMVFGDNAEGAAFWTSIGAVRRSELDVYSLPIAPS